jgi:septal ring factor EnvC (AmiA/AmiB activator)
MADVLRADVIRQVDRVRRRLFGVELLRQLSGWTVTALAVTTGWLLVEPYVASGWPTWTVLAAALAVGWACALAGAVRRRPSTTRSALSLDEAFGLRERVVTSMSLTPADAATPAGQALLQDARERVQNLCVRERFPLHLGRHAWLVPSAAAALALVALFYQPVVSTAHGKAGGVALSDAKKSELEKKLEAAQRPKRDPAVDPNRVKSDELKRLEARLDEISRQPRNTAQQLRDRVKDLSPLEDEIKKLERDRGEKARLLQQQLAMKDGLSPNEAPKDGPASAFQKALADGDIDKARDEAEKLAKKLANNEMTAEEQQQLGKQLNDLQKKLGDLAGQKNKEEQLRKLAAEGKLDPDALERELQQLRQENEKLQDLQKLADKLNQCQQCLKSGDAEGLKTAMAQAAKQLADAAREGQEADDLRDALQKLQETQQAMAQTLEEVDPCPGGT